ncbi:hypothetical protein MRB53_041225 [Persea americana]|nr:hypothetical protein MRB53_041225 [Persea americana]
MATFRHHSLLTQCLTNLRLGMIAPAFAGLLSAFATFGLISFIIFRIIAWRRHYRTFIGYNQYVMLVLNLLIADLQQASSFLISWYWINERKILAPSSACFAQGWLIHSGDLSSAFFVLAIAVHTFMTAILNITIGHRTFYGAILVIWFMAYLMTFIGVAVHPGNYFVRAGAWCWVSSEYENERLFLHYLWVFLVEFTTICLYAITFFALRMKTRKIFRKFREELDSTNPRTVQQVNKVTMLMMLYPCVYVLLTLPLSSGRMWSMAHNGEATSTAFSCAAGALLASCGWVDALLYTLTRKRLLHETMPKRRSNEIEEGAYTAFRTVSVTGQNTTSASAVEMNRFMKDRPAGCCV